MAPEVLKGAKVTTAADTYGFGLVMWEMAAGVRPFDDLSITEVHTLTLLKTYSFLYFFSNLRTTAFEKKYPYSD